MIDPYGMPSREWSRCGSTLPDMTVLAGRSKLPSCWATNSKASEHGQESLVTDFVEDFEAKLLRTLEASDCIERFRKTNRTGTSW